MSEFNGVNAQIGDEKAAPARLDLKRAYLHVSFGQYDQAIAACERAAKTAPEHHLPVALKGSFQMAAGRVRDALATLRGATRRFPKEPLPTLYFAEACFLAGRRRQGERALQKASELCSAGTDEHQDQLVTLIENLRQTWQAVEPSEVPPPLVVELSHGEQV